MFTHLLYFSALIVFGSCLSIGTVSEKQNVTKRDTNSGDHFPDWVPFKNKHGDELGEFLPVEKKNKVRKRLAPPVNFLLRAVAEPEGDDYFDKAAGESDGEEYYEKKDWSDLHRPAEDVDKSKVIVNHTDISDIDGILEILTKRPLNPILEVINDARLSKTKERKAEHKENPEEEFNETEETTTQKPKQRTKEKDVNNEEEDDGEDYEQDKSGKPKIKTEEERANEEKKAKILSSVDELKQRHEEEQRELTNRVKAEDSYKKEFGKDESSEESSDETERPQKRRRIKGRMPTTKPDYDEYEDLNGSLEDKYKINVFKKYETTPSPTEYPRNKPKKEERKDKKIESGKQSLFRNPQLFMMYADSDEMPTEKTVPRGQQKFSSRYTTSPSHPDDRISLVPLESKAGEPTLFFPKTKKNRKRKNKTTLAPNDSFVAETVTDNYKQTRSTALNGTTLDSALRDIITLRDSTASAPSRTNQYTDTTGSGATGIDTTNTDTTESDATNTYTTGTDLTGADTTGVDDTGTATTSIHALSANSDAVADAIAESTDHKKKDEDYHTEKGGGKEHHSEHSEEHEEHGKKAYEGHHENTKAAKGHHDKENHLGKYDDHGGVDKEHGEESGHYGEHNHEEHGKKHAKYEESGKHSKGHSTKGSHDIHKKEEYEKKVEFFEEEGDSGEEEKHGGYKHDKEHSEGGRFDNGNLKAGHDHYAKGESGKFEKGGHAKGFKGHHNAQGYDSHGKRGHKHFGKDGADGGKKWIYHHGSPPKTANLIVIDRRGDQFFHGTPYYG